MRALSPRTEECFFECFLQHLMRCPECFFVRVDNDSPGKHLRAKHGSQYRIYFPSDAVPDWRRFGCLFRYDDSALWGRTGTHANEAVGEGNFPERGTFQGRARNALILRKHQGVKTGLDRELLPALLASSPQYISSV